MNKESLQFLLRPKKNLFPNLLTVLGIFAFLFSNAQVSITLDAEVPTCGDFTDGKINASISGGMAPYTIEWNNGHDGLSLIGIGYGDYSITVTDANGLMASESLTLDGPAALRPAFTFTDDVCDGPPTSVRVDGSGGVPPYTFLWDNGSTDVDRSALDFGTYCVTVEDAVGCRGAGCVIVPMPFEIKVSVVPPLCPAGCDGAAVVEIFGGQTPYSALWSNGVTTALNANLLPGTYTVTVTDANGCVREGVARVPDGEGTLEVTDISTVNPTCGSGGSITVTAEGTNPPLKYQWNNGATTATISDLEAGTYRVTISDVNNCRITDEAILIDNTDLAVTITTDYNCGDQFGSAIANASGGTPPYTFEWNNGQSGATATNLTPSEIYKVSVTDAEGCTVASTAIISDFDELIVSISSKSPTCNNASDGEVTANVAGGSGTFEYFGMVANKGKH